MFVSCALHLMYFGLGATLLVVHFCESHGALTADRLKRWDIIPAELFYIHRSFKEING